VSKIALPIALLSAGGTRGARGRPLIETVVYMGWIQNRPVFLEREQFDALPDEATDIAGRFSWVCLDWK
jgi:hypothetical protein